MRRLTAAYMTRAIMLIFFGEYRGHDHPHDPGPRMMIPLQVLAGLAVVVGFLNIPKSFPVIGDRIGLTLEHWIEPGGGDVFPVIGHGEAERGHGHRGIADRSLRHLRHL